MKALIWNGPNDLTIQEVPRPTPSYGEVLIETKAVGICGTDLEVYAGAVKGSTPPLTIGHEGGGIVREMGEGVSRFREGDSVVVSPIVYCGSCDYCRRGRFSLCDNMKTIGIFGMQGEDAEYFVAPERNCHTLPVKIPWQAAGLVDTLAGPVLAIGRAGVPLGAKVAVFGPGPAGLFFSKLAKLGGATDVYLLGTRDERLQLGPEFGADLAINVRKEGGVEAILDRTSGRGVDIVVEAAGSPQAVIDGLQVLRKGGTFLLYGVLGEEPVPINMQDFLLRELTVFGTSDNTNGYPLAIELLATGKVSPTKLITHTFDLEALMDAFNSDLIRERREGYIKGVALL